jgi:glycosyltransferase involved in cell wall biosynthesis
MLMPSQPSILLLGDTHVGLRTAFANVLRDLGIRVSIATPPGVAMKYAHPDIDVVEYPFDPRHPMRTIKAIKALRTSANIDIVHAFSTTPALFGSLTSWLDPDGTYIRTVNGLGRSFSTTGPRGAIMRSAYTMSLVTLDGRLKETVFQNTDDDNWYGSRPLLRRRLHQVILGSGADTDRFSLESVSKDRVDAAREFLGTKGRPTAVLVGRHLKSKGIDDLAKAATIGREDARIPLLFAVVGPFESNPRVSAEATDSQFGNIEFKKLSTWSDMPALFAAADVVVLPSTYREGIPRVLLEGASLSRPLVTYDMPGCREVVQDGLNGAVLQPGDVSGLSRALLNLLENPEARQAQGANSRKLMVETFSTPQIAAQYATLYRKLVAR